jgi:hypothetical protein
LSPAVALSYFRGALKLCRASGVQPSLLLHPLDFLGAEDEAGLSFFPGMKLPAEKKLEVVSDALLLLARDFTVINLQQHAQIVSAEPGGRVVKLPD